MDGGMIPKTDREWLIKVSGQLGTLSEKFEQLAEKLVEIEEKRIAKMEARISAIESILQQFKGGWKLALVIWGVITAALAWLIKYIWK